MERDANWEDDIDIARQLCYSSVVIGLLSQEKDPRSETAYSTRRKKRRV